MANSVILKSYVKVQEEYTATAVAITPGMLVELTSAGLVQAHSNATADCLPMFAFENELEGKSIDDNYAASGKVQVIIPRRGDQINALLEDGQNVAVGAFLESNAAGALQATTTGTVVAVALEAVDLSASANTAVGRIAVRII